MEQDGKEKREERCLDEGRKDNNTDKINEEGKDGNITHVAD